MLPIESKQVLEFSGPAQILIENLSPYLQFAGNDPQRMAIFSPHWPKRP